MICWQQFGLASVTVMCFFEISHVLPFLFNKDDARLNATSLDLFIEETLTLYCIYESTTHRNVLWKFYGYDSSSRFYIPGNLTYIRVEATNSTTSLHLRIDSVLATDSGRYDCVAGNTIRRTWRLMVHKPVLMEYILIARGQAPWENTVVGEFRVALDWTAWTNCDGCGGHGERRRFGFCYVTWSEGKVHCKSPDVPFLMRTIAKNRPEEIIVDVCYDHCVEQQGLLFVRDQRVDVTNGADVKLTCHDNASVRTPIRWERDHETLRRNDVSFGYVPSQAIYVSKDNRLLLHNIHLPQGGIIRLSCIEFRARRISFDLYVDAIPPSETVSFLDHLYWIAVSTVVQITLFLIILSLYNAARTFSINVSAQAAGLDYEDS